MAASSVQNHPTQTESKSAKKKKTKTSTPDIAPTTPVTTTEAPEAVADSGNDDKGYESPYIKELYKNIRNVNKKIVNASKVDNVLADNPDKSLDELVAARKINADQKTQILKKPSLLASLAQLEEQIAQYKKFDQEYKAQSQVEKAEFEKQLSEKSGKDLSDAVAEIKAEAAASALKQQHESLLVLSQFLSLAAARRAEEDADPESDENMALEGVLLQVYSGDESAVASMTKLINGSDERTSSTSGQDLQTTYGQVKAAAIAYAPVAQSIVEDPVENGISEEAANTTNTEVAEYPIQSDPTIANAGLTEIDEPVTSALTNGHNTATEDTANVGIPPNSGIDEGASNAAADNNWDTGNDLSTSQEWVDVKVPQEAVETDSAAGPTPVTTSTTQSWADDKPDSPPPATNANDGFHEVQRTRGARDRDGQYRGRGRGGDGYRGRGGYRGNDGGYRGRGRGGQRGGPARTRQPQEP